MNTQQNKLILARLTASQWGSRKFDKTASEEVAANHTDASAKEVGRYNKILVNPESIKPVRQAFAELRNRFWFMTSTWNDDGVRVLPAQLYFEFTAKMREARTACEAAVDTFVNGVYQVEVEAAKKRLGTLFKASDYPSSTEIARRFGIDIRFEPLPNPDDVRVWGIGDVAAAQVQKEVTENLQKTIRESHERVVSDVMERAKEYVEKVRSFDAWKVREKEEQEWYDRVRDRASDYEGQGLEAKEARARALEEAPPKPNPEPGQTRGLRETAVENLRDIVQIVVKGLNVEGDPKLTAFADELEQAIRATTVSELREKPQVRTQTTAEVEAIINRFSGAFPFAAAQGGAR